MTPDELKLWLENTLPLFDRLTVFLILAGAVWIGWRIPWVAFFKWLAAPSITSLVFVCAFFLAGQSFLSSDDSYKYLNAYVLFAMRFIFATFGAAFLAVKALKMSPDDNKPQPPKDTP